MAHKLMAYAVKDLQTKTFTNPFFTSNDTTATRGFEQAVNNKDTQYNQYPEDYTLYCVASYNIETGEITPEAIRSIINATKLLKEE